MKFYQYFNHKKNFIFNKYKMSKTKKSSCNPGFVNITHCKTKTSAKKVKELAYDCNINTNIFTNKASQCEELLRKQGGGLKKKVSSKKSPRKKVSSKKSPRKKVSSKKSPRKKVSSKKVSSKKRIPVKQADEYKKLNEMKKKDLSEFSGDITQGKQDGKLVSVNKLRKHELILAIINGKNTKRSSGKRKSKRFLINEIIGMSGEKIKDKDYSYDEVLHRYNYLLKKKKKYLRKTETTFSFHKKYGKFKKHKNVVGYEGIFNAVVFDQEGLKMNNILEYLEDNSPDDEWVEIVNEKLEQHLENYYPEDQKYNFQFGFGGDDRDGSIFFFTKEMIYLPEPMEFKLYGKKYLMTWKNEIILDDLIEVEPIEPI